MPPTKSMPSQPDSVIKAPLMNDAVFYAPISQAASTEFALARMGCCRVKSDTQAGHLQQGLAESNVVMMWMSRLVDVPWRLVLFFTADVD